MWRELRYGENATVRLDLEPEAVVADFSQPRAGVLTNLPGAMEAALQQPREMPPLAQVVFPGDRVAVAVESSLPGASQLVAELVSQLVARGMQPRDITVVQAHTQSEAPPVTARVPESLRQELQLETHQPADSSRLAYLAATRKGRPVYFNRTLCDADVVLPLSLLRPEGSFGYLGPLGGLFPAFSDQTTQQRFLDPHQITPDALEQLRIEVEEAAWLLGIQLVIGVVPGPGGCLESVLAGTAPALAAEGGARNAELWRCPIDRSAGLVVAAIEGGIQQQTWDNLARALYTAAQAVEEQGVVALCTELSAPPGPALQQLAAQGRHDAPERQRPIVGQDARCAALIRALRRQAHLYLLSELDEDLVEELGLAYVARPEEIQSLARKFSSCVLLGNAQYTVLGSEQ